MAIPILMIVLSMTLPARVNRIANLIVASLYVPVTVFNVVGESWMFFYGLGVALEVILLALILRYAWTWPRTAPSATMATSPDRETVRRPAASVNPRAVPVLFGAICLGAAVWASWRWDTNYHVTCR